MKRYILAAVAATGLMMIAAPAFAGCGTCTIQTKTPAAGGKFDYRISCTDDASGDEIVSQVTAANDDEATGLAKAKCN